MTWRQAFGTSSHGAPGLEFELHLQLQFPANVHTGKQQRVTAQVLGSLHSPKEDLDEEASSQLHPDPTPGCCGHLRDDAGMGALSLC